MSTTKRFITMMLCLLLCAPIAGAQQAQDNQPQAQPNNNISQDVMIIIQQEKVRFTAQKTVAEMKLQVFDQAGEMVYDSGAITEQEINWALQNASGEAIKSGLYAYTLSIKEEGAETARVRRGHFIVDRTKDRDSVTDKLWVTSQNDNGVGTELTVARDETTTVAGVSAPSRERGNGRSKTERGGEVERDGESGANKDKTKKDKKSGSSELSVSGTGVAGQIVKFISEEEIGVSEITEVDGSVGIGTTTPQTGFRLHVNGATFLTPSGDNGDITFSTPNGELGMGIAMGPRNADGSTNGPRADIRFDGLTLKLVAHNYGGPPSSANGITVNTFGHVGIGRAYADNLLHIGPGTSSIGNSRVNAVIASNNSDAGIAIAQNSGVNLLVQASGAGGYIGTTSAHPLVLRVNDQDTMVMNGLTTTIHAHDLLLGHSSRRGAPGRALVDLGSDLVLNFGRDWARTVIGSNLVVTGTGIVESSIQSTDERAILSLNSTIGGNNQVWTLENGVFGEAGKFAIFDRTAFKARLTIDTDGLVAVKALQITGGADFAEHFDVSVAPTISEALTTKVEAGMVVSIDPASPGKLTLTTEAYDRRVAGIISGAGGVNPGMMMSQAGTLADGQHPVALSGRVYCWVDASQGAIEPGDLLTTSSTPGHAMKATDAAKAQGAIIGKAMTGLKSGRGLVLVLVTLQ